MADGVAVDTDAPVKIGGSDGANVQTVLTDTSGRLACYSSAAAPNVVVGPVADGSAIAADAPVKIGVQDGTNIQSASGDSAGRIDVIMKGGTYSPQVPTTCALAASTSCPITGLTASTCYRVTCTVDAYYRTGSGTPVALTTDSPLYAKVIEKPVCLLSTETAFAFISASAGTCYVSRMNLTP